MGVLFTHGAAGVDARPLHRDSDTVEEDDDQHNVVEHLVGDDLIAQDPKPDQEENKKALIAKYKKFSGTGNGFGKQIKTDDRSG